MLQLQRYGAVDPNRAYTNKSGGQNMARTNNQKLILRGLISRMWTRLALIRDEAEFRRVWDYFFDKILEQIGKI